MDVVLRVKNLNVSFSVAAGVVQAVRGVTFEVKSREILALVGESGCGKSVTARAMLRLDDQLGVCTKAEELLLEGRDILAASEKEMLEIRGGLAGMIFQDPLTYLNPTMKVGKQVTEALLRRGKMTREACQKEAVRLLELVQIPKASLRAQQYPHQYSGGMRQRAMIAMALACGPRLLLADEPTTALDPTIQLQILTLLKNVRRQTGAAILLITHDLSVVASVADTVAVMYAGKIVEKSGVEKLFSSPAHPYTQNLLRSLPTRGTNDVLYAIKGAPPNLLSPPVGCPFAPRCEECRQICCEEAPEEREIEAGHSVSCWLWHPDCPKGEKQ